MHQMSWTQLKYKLILRYTDMVNAEVQTDTVVQGDKVDAIAQVDRSQLLNEEIETDEHKLESDGEQMVDTEEQIVELNDVTEFGEADHEVQCDTVEIMNTEVDDVEMVDTEVGVEMINTEDDVETVDTEVDVEIMNTEVNDVETVDTEVGMELINTEDDVETVDTEVGVEMMNTEDDLEMVDTEVYNEEMVNTEIQPDEQFRNKKVCEGNADAKFHPLVTKNKGVFKDLTGRYWMLLH